MSLKYFILFLSFSDAFVRVTVERSDALYHVSAAVGWIYFLAWSISFYPQIYSNYKRKSVVGLNFDFLSLNIVGFIMYALFNCGLYWIPEIEVLFGFFLVFFRYNTIIVIVATIDIFTFLQQEYFARYPKGLNPVQVNDIFFALHAVCATLVTIVQCFIYDVSCRFYDIQYTSELKCSHIFSL